MVKKAAHVTLLLWLCLWSGWVNSEDTLPVEHEVERLMMLLDQSVEVSDWSRVEETSLRIRVLNADLPDRFYFYQGKLHLGKGELAEARRSFVSYVVNAGQEGEHYRDALQAINRIEQSGLEASELSKPEKLLPDIGSASEGYTKTLQALYLTDDAQAALILHINGLLATNAYRGTKIIKQEQRTGVIYQIAVDERYLLIQEKSFLQDTPTLRIEKLSLPGTDPFWEYRCSKSEQQCWIYHPQKEFDRWLLLAYDNLAVSELVTAFSHLVRLMQR